MSIWLLALYSLFPTNFLFLSLSVAISVIEYFAIFVIFSVSFEKPFMFFLQKESFLFSSTSVPDHIFVIFWIILPSSNRNSLTWTQRILSRIDFSREKKEYSHCLRNRNVGSQWCWSIHKCWSIKLWLCNGYFHGKTQRKKYEVD